MSEPKVLKPFINGRFEDRLEYVSKMENQR
jgi:hypothetical protein